MVKSFLNLLVRNRKIHLLVFVVFLVSAVTHTMGRQGITINYTTDDPHSKELTYQSISETIHDGLIVTDIRIQRCMRGFSCSAPSPSKPGFWVKVPTKLNLYPVSTHLFNYYMYVEKTRGNEAKRYVIDIQFTLKNEQPKSKLELKWLTHKVASNSYIWVGYLDTLDFAAPLIRDVNVLYGKHDMIDARRHWKFSPSPIQLPFKQSIHPKLSMLIVAVNDEMAIFNADQEFDNFLKKNEVIVNVDPGFKVVQVSDMHIGQDSVLCEGQNCKFDVNTLRFLDDVLRNEEDVKLVMFTGDIIDFSRVKHFESAILKALAPVLKAGLPFIFTFGDSDHEWSNPQSKINILNFISSLPLCYNKKPSQLDHRLHGLTNGNLKVFELPPTGGQVAFDYNKIKLDEPSAVITYLDSEEMNVDETQSNYLYRLAKETKNVDFKLLFFHNPLPNFRPAGQVKLIGSYNEKHEIKTKSSDKFLSDVKDCGYRAVCVGHEHENDSCIWDEKDGKQILLCYGSVAGESANTRLDSKFQRRLRVFDIRFDAQEIYSWKRKMEPDSKSVIFDGQLIFKLKADETFVEGAKAAEQKPDEKVKPVEKEKPAEKEKPVEKEKTAAKLKPSEKEKPVESPEEDPLVNPVEKEQPAGKPAGKGKPADKPAEKETPEKEPKKSPKQQEKEHAGNDPTEEASDEAVEAALEVALKEVAEEPAKKVAAEGVAEKPKKIAAEGVAKAIE